MNRFENYWLEEARWEEEQNLRRRERRKRTREERRARAREQMLTIIGVCLFLLVALLATTVYAESRYEAKTEIAQSTDDGRLPGDDVPATERCYLTEDEVQEDFENEKIEAALVETGYFRDDIPLDYETQAYLRAACDESGVEYEVMLGLIDRETGFQNINGDGGDSIGYCQIQPKWWSGLMTDLGVNDLTQSLDNFRTGCAILSGLTEKYGSLEYALTAYNTGKPGKSEYADDVLQRIEKWRRS